jgi:hypothetical protein
MMYNNDLPQYLNTLATDTTDTTTTDTTPAPKATDTPTIDTPTDTPAAVLKAGIESGHVIICQPPTSQKTARAVACTAPRIITPMPTPTNQKTDTPTPTMQAELAANVKQHKTTLLDLRKKYELAKLGLEVFDQQAKEIYNKILSENTFTVSHDCPSMSLKPGDRITDEEYTFLMSEGDWQRYMKLTGAAMTAAGLTTEDGTYTTNWHQIRTAAKTELVNFLIDHIIPAALRSQFAKVRDSIIWQDKILATFESCIK